MSASDTLKVLRYFWLKMKPKKSVYTSVGSPSDIFIPTQKDKPSPNSSLSSRSLRGFLRSGFPINYKIRPVTDTNSMEPVIDDNHLVVTEPFNSSVSLRVGDIIVYRYPRSNPEMLILHRVISVNNSFVETKGDNNFFKDKRVYYDQILERCVGSCWHKQNELLD